MPPPIDWMPRTSSQIASLSLADVSGVTTCGALSTAITPTSSNGPSVSIAAQVPRLARSIFVRPSPTGTAMLPERSSATAIASDSLRCSFLISIDTGRYGSSCRLEVAADAERRAAAGDEQPAAEIRGEPRQRRRAPAGRPASAGTFSRMTARYASEAGKIAAASPPA